MPLQFVPMIENQRTGPINFRSYAIATGELKAREGEAVIDRALVEKAFAETDLAALLEQRHKFHDLNEATKQIRRTWTEQDASGAPASLERLTAISGRILAVLDQAVTSRDPSLRLIKSADPTDQAEAEANTPGRAVSAGPITSAGDAAAALAEIIKYWNRTEPSNPALILIRQAQQLIGKSFLEVIQVLVPQHMPNVAFNIGKEKVFGLPIEQLSPLVKEAETQETADGNDQEAAPDSPIESTEGEQTVEDSNESQAESTTEVIATPSPDRLITKPHYQIDSRNEALAHLDAVAAYFRMAEPSSPIPFLIDRARDLAVRDFLSVLGALLPENTLTTIGPAG
jgi:type VI secretion system protein ImpA